ncbi:hypothetical protein NL676_008740 [Syzygium grande]|nr:hypothetical protein NL676_008740 [Syzygium grande]
MPRHGGLPPTWRASPWAVVGTAYRPLPGMPVAVILLPLPCLAAAFLPVVGPMVSGQRQEFCPYAKAVAKPGAL